jgi:hypothetical protein
MLEDEERKARAKEALHQLHDSEDVTQLRLALSEGQHAGLAAEDLAPARAALMISERRDALIGLEGAMLFEFRIELFSAV